MVSSPLRDVSDTALWVASCRASESERPDALFRDPHARRMAGARGVDILRTLPFAQTMAWSMVVRTAVLDELILQCVAAGARTVVNLGAGLDTRAFRLALPPTLRWLDIDLPAMVDYRRDCLRAEPAMCDHEHVAADLGDPARRQKLLGTLAVERAPLLAVSEGLLIYLEPEQVGSLARELHDAAGARWWATDLIRPMALNTVGRFWQSQLAAAGAPFRFAPEDGGRFFEPFGWHEKTFRSLWDESLRLGRSVPLASFWSSVWNWAPPGAQAALRRTAGVALLERL